MLRNGCVQKSNKKSSHTKTETSSHSVIISVSWIACFHHSKYSLYMCSFDGSRECLDVWVCMCDVCVLFFSMENASKIDKIDSSNWFYSYTHTPAYQSHINNLQWNTYHIINISMSVYIVHGECVCILCVCWHVAPIQYVQYSSENTVTK